MTGSPKMRRNQESETIGERYWRSQANDKSSEEGHRNNNNNNNIIIIIIIIAIIMMCY
jgi:hypothetical protein